MNSVTRALKERLLKNSSVGAANQCWEWRAARHGFGYGVLRIDGKNFLAHRIAYQLANGPIPTGLVIRHRCDNPSCVNPGHLVAGTHADNMQDAVDRGRFPRGEQRSKKLRTVDAQHILASTESADALATQYGISPDYVRMIKRGIRWGHLKSKLSERAQKRRKHGYKGEGHWQGRLTEDDVRKIRADARKQREIAADYGVHQVTISEIKLGKIWGHVR
jgi:hypothetical protein